MNQEIKEMVVKRLKSLAWRVAIMALTLFISEALDVLNVVELPLWIEGLLGLVLGEVSKYLNTRK